MPLNIPPKLVYSFNAEPIPPWAAPANAPKGPPDKNPEGYA